MFSLNLDKYGCRICGVTSDNVLVFYTLQITDNETAKTNPISTNLIRGAIQAKAMTQHQALSSADLKRLVFHDVVESVNGQLKIGF